MNYTEIQQWVRAKRDIIIVCFIVLAVLVSIIIGMRMQKSYSAKQKADEQARNPVKVRLSPSQQVSGEKNGNVKKAPASFFLKPSPDELLSIIHEMGAAELPPENLEYKGLRVMWPVYFFQIIEHQDGRSTVLLDVSKDGFGVTIKTEIDTQLFPEIIEMETGEKIWIAGEISGVDPTGTGSIHMVTEEVRFDENLMEAIKDASTSSQ